MTGETILVAVLALAVGALVGWLVAGRRGHALAADLAAAQARGADADLVRQAKDAVERERNAAMQEAAGLRASAAGHEAAIAVARTELETAREGLRELAALRAETAARGEAHAAQVRQLTEARDALSAQFDQIAARALEGAQRQFLARADERFRQSEEQSGQSLKALLQPVNDRLQRYEEGVQKIEAERRDAFGMLNGQIEAMRVGQEKVSGEAAKLVNALRNAPKARGRWGEQQLRNVLESCGLAEHTDFLMEVSVADGEGGRLRPDAIVTVPGGKSLIIDAKVSLNAYQDAFGAVDESERAAHLALHVQSIRTHIAGLSAKSYWAQFDDAPDYVIMFIPGEHFLSAALDHDAQIWEYAFDRRVLLATPTNLVAIARTVAAVWRQEKLAREAQAIGALGKELYDRLAKASEDLRKVGSGLTSAVNNYNNFVSSFESRALVSARKFRDLNIEPGARELGSPEPVEVLARYGDDVPALAEKTPDPA